MRIGTNSAALPVTNGKAAPAKSPRERFNDTVKLTAASTGLTAVGYGVGAGIGAVAYNMGGNYAYALMGPASGALLGGMTGVAANTGSKAWANVSQTAALATAGCLIGDAVGHGLTALTGNSIYQTIGAGAGALNGAVLSSNFMGAKPETQLARVAEYTTLALGGSTVGAALGCLTGTLVSSVTGNPIYTSAAPILGAVAGGMAGLAANFQIKKNGEKNSNQN